MSGCGKPRREGLQVVRLSHDATRRYEVNEEALASVLLWPEVRSLPVVVVSVAGAYRGGKSFILDFFLRYLKAPRTSQLNGEWMGAEDEELQGFYWRGGGESNTKGIHLWPEPIIVTIDRTGEKVAVLLMDTQGTFDTESDMGDNSAIFALSMLLSSVQIYNLRANIGEDDLQHLQLFTEYGKLACDGEGKAFQTLKFLVRDWMNAYEHPHGFAGGEALLRKRLAPRSKEKIQLQQVREHIHSCFEKLLCFLMPHPGLAVGNQNFKGRLCDITENFRMSLLELVPALFDPNNLTPKLINGDKVQAQSLLEYFKRYVDIFNSDDLPQATTIFQATADACMMSAVREARECYESQMDSNIVEDQSVTTSMIHEWHEAAVTAAVEHFKGKKKLGSQDSVNTHLENLQKELKARLSLYQWQNEAKVRDTVSLAKKTYEDNVSAVCETQSRLCLHERDLHALHESALLAALQVFRRARPRVPQDHDDEKDYLVQSLEQYYQHLCTVNEQNNRSAKLEAREVYLTRMKDQASQTGISSDELKKQHEKALEEAIKHFHTYRNRRTEHTDDPDVEQLKQEITVYFGDFERANVNSNMWAMQVAEFTFNNSVTSAWGPQSCCFHPKALLELLNTAKERALQQFLADRPDTQHDDFKDKLIANLQTRYTELVKINEFNNKQVVEQAFSEYTRRMDKHSQPNLSSILIAPFVLKVFGLLPRYHEDAKRKALSIFHERRRGTVYDDDEYLSKLKNNIENAFAAYKNPLQALGRELGIKNL